MEPTPRAGLPRYEDTDSASFSAQVNAISERADAVFGIFVTGTEADRPAPGIKGRYYLAENGTKSGAPEGDLYFDDGEEWQGPRNAATGPPIGSMMDWPMQYDPTDADGVTRWMLCDGRAISRTTYAKLFQFFNELGLLPYWGEGNGTSTFNIPNTQGRFTVHPGGSGVTSIGQKGGEQTHSLTVAELAPHTHSYQEREENFTSAQVPGNIEYSYGAATLQTGSTGEGKAHNNMPPFVGVAKIIRVL